jgi:hypothetical protein
VDTAGRAVHLEDGTMLPYDRLLICTGSHPLRLPVPGIDSPNVHSCWTLEDARHIAAKAKKGARVLQIGAGFIGCIIMEALASRGVKLDIVEQPVKSWDIAGMQYVTERIDTPVVADESVTSITGVAEIIQRRAADIINIKLMKTGGLTDAVRIADLAATYGVECMIGCMLEGAISVAAAAHLAVARADVITRVDLDGPTLGRFNPVDSNVCFADAEITIGDAPGLGITNVHGLEPIDA